MTTDMEFHEVANLFPFIEGQEFDELVEDIRVNGLQQPIWTYEGKIIDGRNRYRGCKKAGVEPRFQEWNGQGSLVMFVISLNVKRRHLTSSQLAVVSLGVEKQLAKEAAERQAKGGGDKVSVFAPAVPENFQEPLTDKGESAQIAAKMLNTNQNYVVNAKKIEEKAPELIEHILEGTLTIPDAKAIASMPVERRETIVQKAVEKKEEEGKRVSRAVRDAIWEEEEKELVEKKKKEAEKLAQLEKELEHTRHSTKEVKSGQWWKLGQHLLYCGDSSYQEFIAKAETVQASFAFADPPYNAGAADWDHGFEWNHNYLAKVAPVVAVTPGISSIKNFMNKNTMPYIWSMSYWIDNGMTRGVLGFGNWIYVALFAEGSLYKNSQDQMRLSNLLNDTARVSITNGDNDRPKHKGRKPLQMMKHIIELFTKPNQVVIDPFLGSGTTLIICEETNRVCIGAEKEVEFCKAIIAHWENISGKKAEVFEDAASPIPA